MIPQPTGRAGEPASERGHRVGGSDVRYTAARGDDAVTIGGDLLRGDPAGRGAALPDLALRPMHADEAVHADKFGTLLEEGQYAYDSSEFHGPTLYYLTLPSAWLQGIRRYVELDEATLRAVPAVLGILLVAATFGSRGFLGWPGAALAALLTAVSPAMVFYSRYFIHEVPLVLFTFGALLGACWYLQRAGAFPALVTGVCVGLMHATKETAPLALGAMVLALALTLLVERRHGLPPTRFAASSAAGTPLLALVAAAVVSGVLYSSFLGNPGGLVDSVRSYWIWLGRAGSRSMHSHPWDYYLRLLIHFPAEGTPVWSEGLILVLAARRAAAGWGARGVPGADSKVLRFLSLLHPPDGRRLRGDPLQDPLEPPGLPARDDPPGRRRAASGCCGPSEARAGRAVISAVLVLARRAPRLAVLRRELPLRRRPAQPVRLRPHRNRRVPIVER